MVKHTKNSNPLHIHAYENLPGSYACEVYMINGDNKIVLYSSKGFSSYKFAMSAASRAKRRLLINNKP